MKKVQKIVLVLSGILTIFAGSLHAGILFLFGEPPASLKVFSSCFALVYDAPAKAFDEVVGHGYHFPYIEMTHAEFITDWLIYIAVSFIAWGGLAWPLFTSYYIGGVIDRRCSNRATVSLSTGSKWETYNYDAFDNLTAASKENQTAPTPFLVNEETNRYHGGADDMEYDGVGNLINIGAPGQTLA